MVYETWKMCERKATKLYFGGLFRLHALGVLLNAGILPTLICLPKLETSLSPRLVCSYQWQCFLKFDSDHFQLFSDPRDVICFGVQLNLPYPYP